MSWSDKLTIIICTLTIVGFTWVLHTNHIEHSARAEQWWREDKKEYEKNGIL